MQTVAHEVATKELAEHLQPLFDASPTACTSGSTRSTGSATDGSPSCSARLAGRAQRHARLPPTDGTTTTRTSTGGTTGTECRRRRTRPRSGSGKRKDGSTFEAETDMIPLAFGGHTFAYHFVRPSAGAGSPCRASRRRPGPPPGERGRAAAIRDVSLGSALPSGTLEALGYSAVTSTTTSCGRSGTRRSSGSRRCRPRPTCSCGPSSRATTRPGRRRTGSRSRWSRPRRAPAS